MEGLRVADQQYVREEFSYNAINRDVVRTVVLPDGSEYESSVRASNGPPLPDAERELFDLEWLRSASPPTREGTLRAEVRVVDLFCGLGGMSIGVREACRALGLKMRHVWAADTDPTARRMFERAFDDVSVDPMPIQGMLDGDLGSTPTRSERELRRRLGSVSIVMGGPPCQGHSNLNNHTRRRDPKNALYLRMARAAEVLRPRHVIIENVPGVRHDEGSVMDLTKAHLQKLGYVTDAEVIKAEDLGVPQTRHRMFLVASRENDDDDSLQLGARLQNHRVTERSALWACEDLETKSGRSFDSASTPKPETKKRIEWLYAKPDRFDLPDDRRPDCHRLKAHRYQAVYGRMFPERPAPTITTGFLVMGQGRFVHPTKPRTLTPHEGARLQFLPDWLSLPPDLLRKDYAALIGNAVPPKLTYVLALELLGTMGGYVECAGEEST